MKTKLWIVIIVVIGFLGFLMGYSAPSFFHADDGVSNVRKTDEGTKMDNSAEEYYKNLQKEEN